MRITILLLTLFLLAPAFAADYQQGQIVSNLVVPAGVQPVEITGKVQAVSVATRTITVDGKRFRLVEGMPTITTENEVVDWTTLTIGDEIAVFGYQQADRSK